MRLLFFRLPPYKAPLPALLPDDRRELRSMGCLGSYGLFPAAYRAMVAQ